MTMQAQVRAVSSGRMRGPPPAGVVSSGGSLAVAAPFARVPFALQPGPMRVVGEPGAPDPSRAAQPLAASELAPQGVLEGILIFGGLLVVGALVAGGFYAACTNLDKANAALCKANCNNQPCKKRGCLGVGICCEHDCPNAHVAPPGSPWGGP
jgi:hypothetical protein